MSIKLNSSGLPAGTGSLHYRGCVWWAIYRDVDGRKIQANTGTSVIADARRVLAFQALKVLKARMAALVEVLDEGQHQAGAAVRGQGTGRVLPAAAARDRQKNSEGGSR
jgi:hypothetical protein